MSERLLNAAEVGQLLGVPTTTIWKWHQAGKIPSYKLAGSLVRFRQSEIDDWIESQASDGFTGRSASHDEEPAACLVSYDEASHVRDERSR
jgi:excisionase family DNA binding protein